MKKYLLFLITALCFNTAYCQVLYTENFDNHSVGNLGTDPTGTIPGQWGWSTYLHNTLTNGYCTIINEAGRGRVLDISTGLTSADLILAFKTNLSSFMNNRIQGNNVIKFEIDYFTGPKGIGGTNTNYGSITLRGVGSFLTTTTAPHLASVVFLKENGVLNSVPLGLNPSQGWEVIPFNTWIKFVFYLDYSNRKIYFEIPYFNKVYVDDFLKNESSTNLIQDFFPNTILLQVHVHSSVNEPQQYTRNRYDNIKITAINAVPPEIVTLSNNEQFATKFSMYPNPSANVVNISNSENILVKQIMVYDVTGKLVSTQTFNNETEVQLNVENLASGTYLMHLQTNKGLAVKKLIKK